MACCGTAEEDKVVEDDCLEEIQAGQPGSPASELRGGFDGVDRRDEGGGGEGHPRQAGESDLTILGDLRVFVVPLVAKEERQEFEKVRSGGSKVVSEGAKKPL